MLRNRRVWMGFALVSLLLMACVNLGGSSGLPIDSQAPDFGVKKGDKTITVTDLAGQVVVVNFWSST